MDILYIVGTGSKHDNIELRMSLRSICKYGKGVGRVIVAGDPPEWLSDEVVQVPIPVKYSRKHHEMMNRVQHCVDFGIVDGEFLCSSDDHFYVKPVDFDHYPYYFKAVQLRDTAVLGERCYGYHLSLKQTRELLQRHKLPIGNFEQHCNTHMHAKIFRDYKALMDESFLLERGSPPTTLAMNAWLTTGYAPKEFVKREDVKVNMANTVADIRAQIKGSECFSIGDSLFATNAIMDFFKEEYPDKCRFEN